MVHVDVAHASTEFCSKTLKCGRLRQNNKFSLVSMLNPGLNLLGFGVHTIWITRNEWFAKMYCQARTAFICISKEQRPPFKRALTVKCEINVIEHAPTGKMVLWRLVSLVINLVRSPCKTFHVNNKNSIRPVARRSVTMNHCSDVYIT